MRTKKFRALALVAVLALMLTAMAVLFAACGKDGGGETPGTGTTGVGTLVSDEGLKTSNKLKAMFTFEGENGKGNGTAKAINPYTGAEQKENNATYSADGATIVANPDEATKGQSANALSVKNGGITLGKLTSAQVAGADEGLSVSFWAYNNGLDDTKSDEKAGTLSFDFMNIIGDGVTTVTWGNVKGQGENKHFHPDSSTVIGRGAYTNETYAAARAELTNEQLAKFDTQAEEYAGWNAIAGNRQGAAEGSAVYKIAQAYQKVWRYVTVVIDKEDGVLFYNNGRLAYQYAANRFSVGAFGSTWAQAFEGIMLSAMEEGGAEYVLGMFSDTIYPEGVDVYVDDVIIGTALEATEAQALYENLSGKKYTADDIALTSTMGADEAAKQEAINAYLTELKSDESIAEARAAFLSTGYSADDYTVENGQTDCTVDDDTKYFIPVVDAESGTFKMQFSGVMLSDLTRDDTTVFWHTSAFDFTFVNTWLGAAALSDGYWGWDGVTEPKNEWTWEWPEFNAAQSYGFIEVTVESKDGATIDVTADIYYYFYGQVGTQVTLSLTDGTQFEYTIQEQDALAGTCTLHLGAENLGSNNVKDLKFRFNTQKAWLGITEVKGVTE